MREQSSPRGALLLILLVCATGVVFRLHGFSISAWHYTLDQSSPNEVLAGTPRLIRSDDWLATLPLSIAQGAHRPPFPLVNSTIGLGQNALLMYQAPVWNLVTLARPQSWGFFLGVDLGLAWAWWVRVGVLLCGAYLLFYYASGGRRWESFLPTALLAVQPFVNYWSLGPWDVLGYAALGAVTVVQLAIAQAFVPALCWAAALGASATGFLAALYPAYQVPMCWWGAGAVLGLGATTPRFLRPSTWLTARAPLLLVAAVFPVLLAWLYYSNVSHEWELLRNTVYPGSRSVSSGEIPWERIFAGNFLVLDPDMSFGALGNICEASGQLILIPALAVMTLGLWRTKRSCPSPLECAMWTVVVLVSAHAAVNLPPVVTRLIGGTLVPGQRVLVGLLLSHTLLTYLVWKRVRQEGARSMGTYGVAAVVLSVAVQIVVALWYRQAVPDYTLAEYVLSVSWLAVLAAFLAAGSWAFWLVACAGYAVTSLTFNPLVGPGFERYLAENEVSAAMLREHRNDARARWVVFGDTPVADLPRMVGVSSVSGLYVYPQEDLWAVFDPERKYRDHYNRYAHVTFAATEGDDITVESPTPDSVRVLVDPRSEAFQKLGVKYFVVAGRVPRVFRDEGSFVRKERLGPHLRLFVRKDGR